MKKFKRIAALIVATVTLAATAMTASAANWLEYNFRRGEIKSTYYIANNIVHYTSLLKGYNKNMFTFSSVDKTLMEGNIVLSVDFANLNATSSKEKYDISDELFDKIPDYMDGLYLKDATGKFITEGKYPLTVNYNAPKAYINVMVDTNWRVFNNFDLTGAYYTAYGKTDTLTLHYQIKDIFVLPSYHIVLEEISNSSTRAKFSGEFVQNTCGYATINRKDVAMTVGSYDIKIPSQYRGKSFNAYINGMKVGKVTIPYKSTNSVSYTNY